MKRSRRHRIGIMGASECSPEVYALAHEVGSRVAKLGAVLVCGGRTGVMEGAAAGARQEGGTTVGILAGTDPEDANPYIDIPIVTGMGDARNAINILTSEVIIAIHGGFGTLSEIALALKAGRPVIALKSWSVVHPEGTLPPGIIKAESAAEAVQAALRLLETSGI